MVKGVLPNEMTDSEPACGRQHVCAGHSRKMTFKKNDIDT